MAEKDNILQIMFNIESNFDPILNLNTSSYMIMILGLIIDIHFYKALSTSSPN